ncbi:hypothetical protein [Nocardioides sp. T2.26MG-1]|uniref:hypothetical protein n=1 Tax=Nocardioides sp. T2.26MG-1 TaxID=3041166 RepID=UPI002477508C|nr:hypothetical protein [Nocardioides sp. T2.26MG-1]CAI9409592.1 hypothetical protein HIDPHFAB_01318 [Nocardioides sp. T2.26MG-1]
MVTVPIDELDAAGVLAAAEHTLRQRRAAEVEDLLLIAQWADLHATDPRRGPGGQRVWCGVDRLVEIGGDGTPLVQDLCLPELAVARQTHTLALRAAMADVLDLRHRLPRTWAVVTALECEPWVARKVATLSRDLDQFQIPLVDAAVADAIAGESPARVLDLARAKIIEADPARYAAHLDEHLRRRYVGLSRTDQHGLRHVIAHLEAGPAVWVDHLVNRIADALDARRDLVPHLPADATRDELRAEAFGWLAHPDRVLDLLDPPTPDETPQQPARRRRSRAVVYVHLHEAALQRHGVARVEDLGPLLLDQVTRLLGHAHVDLKPVIDLHDRTRVNAYEHPETVKERVHLRTVGEVFPHATRISRHVDIDHPVEYDEHGPPGQTGDHNAAPLGRTSHRAKTHLGYRIRQLGPDSYLWRTPHGLHRHVDHTGTHVIDAATARDLERTAAIQRALDTFVTRLDETA